MKYTSLIILSDRTFTTQLETIQFKCEHLDPSQSKQTISQHVNGVSHCFSFLIGGGG